MFSIPHCNTDDGSPQLRHAQTVQTPQEINLQQNIRALEPLSSNYLRVQEPECVVHLLNHSFDNRLGLECNRKCETTSLQLRGATVAHRYCILSSKVKTV